MAAPADAVGSVDAAPGTGEEAQGEVLPATAGEAENEEIVASVTATTEESPQVSEPESAPKEKGIEAGTMESGDPT